MHELVKTTNPVTISAAQAHLKAEGIESFVFDVHMSVLEGGIGAFPRRLMIHENDAIKARHLLKMIDIDTVEER